MEKLTDSLVKGVNSGDCVILSGNIKKGVEEVPEEKVIYLSYISSPKCVSNNNPEDEPYGTEARNYLKSLILGKVVKYTIEYKVGDKQFGKIFFENKNINLEMVRSGYCKISYNKNVDSKGEYYSKLQVAENDAKKLGLNIWNEDKEEVENHKFKVKTISETDHKVFAETFKGKTFNAIVDYVFNVSIYSLLILEDQNCYVKASLRFVKIPSKENIIYRTGKAFVERIILHREVKITIFGVDDHDNLIVDIEDEKKRSMATVILKKGYSKLFIPTNIICSKDDITLVKESQEVAQNEGVRVWAGEKGKVGDSESTKKKLKSVECSDFEGKCIQVFTGDSFSIKSNKNNEVYRIFLSHSKAPTFAKPNVNEADQPWAWQAKEFLRRMLVGKNMRVEYDFTNILKDDRKMHFYSAFFTNDKGTEININEALIEAGLVNFNAPKGNIQDISKHFEIYSTANSIAKEKKVGLYSNKDPGNPNYSDLISANPKKKKEFINFLNNKKNLSCVVEFAFSASKLKLRIDKQKCMILFSIDGIKAFSKDKNNTKLYDNMLNLGIEFINENYLQREGTCDILYADKFGNYFGNLTINGVNVAITLLEKGHAVFDPYSSTHYINEYKKAEKVATEEKVNIWSHDGISYFLKEGEAKSNNSTQLTSSKITEKNIPETIKMRVTDICDFTTFYANFLPNTLLTKIENTLNDYDSEVIEAVPLNKPIKKGTYCVARYPEDYKYYRAKILDIFKNSKYEVEFIDYGSIATVDEKDLIKMDNNISDIEPQAKICEFAYLKYSKNSKKKAQAAYPDFVNIELTVNAQLYYTYTSGGKLKNGLVLYYGKNCNDNEQTYHYDLLNNGFAKIDSKKGLHSSLAELKEYQKKAEENSKGMWAQGEESDDDNNEDDY